MAKAKSCKIAGADKLGQMALTLWFFNMYLNIEPQIN